VVIRPPDPILAGQTTLTYMCDVSSDVAVRHLLHLCFRDCLTVLDFIGNIPFGGMVSADYLGDEEWRSLAAGAGYRIAETVEARYRGGPFALLFPNRLETTMRWERS